ncbi:bacteriocin immunity protein [Companilactobacillus zhachilii]|jgi:Enterocin A Immunity.|uniref:Bacteriocin immunity protein n=1 Tax=Companilactobacillus zhachilii TaxID=2304606 RepID=A0A386PSA9_9LACO|nr:bacteriocin immunity protein [Companilactobacillus zhachilii]AYE38322.1 bacteriocin immunity protein [Companilactobacillus zhachilii]MBL3529988.1 bacteriocin immunity protein [Companilactobacillus zhachilii]
MNKQVKNRVLEAFIDEFLIRLREVAADPAMKKRPDLEAIVYQDIKILEQTDNLDKLAPKMFQQISSRYIEEPANFPKSLIELYYWARVETNKYDAVAWSDVQAGTNWLEK